ncbi:unnamed protein product [Fusarium graminearum]|nr:unnamed protein product [Fusarium graminearum]
MDQPKVQIGQCLMKMQTSRQGAQRTFLYRQLMQMVHLPKDHLRDQPRDRLKGQTKVLIVENQQTMDQLKDHLKRCLKAPILEIQLKHVMLTRGQQKGRLKVLTSEIQQTLGQLKHRLKGRPKGQQTSRLKALTVGNQLKYVILKDH